MPIHLVHAAGLADAHSQAAGHSLLVESTAERLSVLARGPAAELGQHPAADGARQVDLRHAVVLPALVNAHAHLDLTALGPRPFDHDAGFAAWLDGVREARDATDVPVLDAVGAGVERSLAGGVIAIADIAGSDLAQTILAIRDSPLRAIVFAELFGLGDRQSAALGRVASIAESFEPDARVRLGLQPHAPYSAGPALYAAAATQARDHGVPVATHLAESLAERRLLAEVDGPMAEFLRSLGLFTTEARADFGSSRTPVHHIREELAGARWLLAHVNDCADEDLETLAASDATVVYCPRSAAYFAHERELGPHRYRDMLAAGVNVAVGTDSILNIPPSQADRLSPLDDLRLLHERDGADAQQLLAMATINGARAMSLPEHEFLLGEGEVAGLIAIDVSRTGAALPPAQRALRSDAPPRMILPTTAQDPLAEPKTIARKPT